MENNRENLSNKLSKKAKNIITIVGGAFAGVVNGLFGGGAGMIIVPLLIFLLGYQTKVAHATAILIVLPLSLLSGLFYAYFGTLRLLVALPVSIGVTVGGVIGAFLLSKLSSKWIILVFSVVMVLAGLKMIFF